MPTSVSDPLHDPAVLAAFAGGLEAAEASCATMSGGRLVVSSSEVRRLSLTDVLVSAGGPETAVAAVYIGFSGPLNGHGLLMLPALDARTLARAVLGDLTDDSGDGEVSDAGLIAIERSALEEVANVAITAVLNRLGDHFGEPIYPAPPAFVFDMAGAVLDAVVSDVAEGDDSVLAARTRFTQDGRAAAGVLVVLPHPVMIPEPADRSVVDADDGS